jgi:hypothetical protein
MRNFIKSKGCILLVFASILFGCTKENDTVKDVIKDLVKEIDIKTLEVNNITTTTAVVTAKLNSSGGYVMKSRGICVNTKGSPTMDDKDGFTIKDAANVIGDYSGSITGLLSNTKYYSRAYISTDGGVFYGNEINFTTATPNVTPKVTTSQATDVLYYSAHSGGVIGQNVDTSTIIACGVCYSSVNTTPSISDNKFFYKIIEGKFSGGIINLDGDTKYYTRAFITTNLGTVYGEVLTFVTKKPGVPVVGTLNHTNDNNFETEIISDGGEYITRYGICFSDYIQTPILDYQSHYTDSYPKLLPSNYGKIWLTIPYLVVNKTYYMRAFATNRYGTSYGDIIKFTYTK